MSGGFVKKGYLSKLVRHRISCILDTKIVFHQNPIDSDRGISFQTFEVTRANFPQDHPVVVEL